MAASVKNREKKKRMAHILAAVVILVHAFERYDSGHSTYLAFAIAGAVFLTIAILHPVIERRAPWIDGVFLVIEGVLSLIIAAEYFHAGKRGLPLCYLLAGVLQLIASVVLSRRAVKQHAATH